MRVAKLLHSILSDDYVLVLLVFLLLISTVTEQLSKSN